MKFIIKEFFGKEGLTVTSANHIANMAKELYSKLEFEINGITAFDQTAKIIGEPESVQIHIGTSKDDFALVEGKLEKIAECKGLIAYLREAIKEREQLYRSILGYEDLEGRNGLKYPERKSPITREQVMASWSVAELIRYYRLEAKCAALGKYIHEDGTLNLLRKNFYKVSKNPIEITGKGRDTIAITNTPTLSSEEIESKFFALQEEYRNCQAELNGMKHSIDQAIEEDTLEKQNLFKAEYEKYSVELEKITSQEEVDRSTALKELQKLKIVIPTRFQSIYDEISKLSKSN